MVFVLDGDDHVLVFRKFDPCSDKGFVEGFIEVLCNTKALTCGFHFRSKADICAADLLEGEYRHLNRDMFCLRLKSRFVAHIFEFVSEDDLGCQRHDRDSCHLADVRYGTAGTWVYFDNIYFFAADDELDVDHSDYMECLCQTACVLCDRILCILADSLCRIYGDTVTGMDTCTFDVLHDSRDQDILAIAYRINFNLLTHQVLIYQDRVFLCDPVDDADEFIYIFVVDRDLHTLSAKYIGWADEYRVAEFVGCFFGFFCGKYGVA